jgi:hypothetical protein
MPVPAAVAAVPALANIARVGMAGVAALIASQQARKAARSMQSVSFGPGNVIDSPSQVEENVFGQTQLPMPRQKTFADYVIENPFLILGTNTRVMNNPSTPRMNTNETLTRDAVKPNQFIESEQSKPEDFATAEEYVASKMNNPTTISTPIRKIKIRGNDEVPLPSMQTGNNRVV